MAASDGGGEPDDGGGERADECARTTGGDGGGRVFASDAARRAAAVRVAALVGGVLLFTAGLRVAVPEVTDPTWVRARVEAFGPLAPAAFVALQAAQVVVAPVPGQLLGGVAGYLFGAVGGTAYSLAGVTAGSAVAFAGSRRYGRPFVERVVAADALDRWDAFVRRDGVAGLFVLFLLPAFPDDLLCFAAGLSDVRLRTFLALVVLGRAPSFLAVAYAGDRLGGGRPAAFAAAVALLGVLSLVGFLARDRIARALDRAV